MSSITVVMPVYNNEKYLRPAIESVLKSSYKEFELLIIDDCSQDSSFEIALQYQMKDERIRLIRNKRNLGAAQNQKKGILESKGDYVIFAAADDITEPHRLKVCKEVFDSNKSVGLIISNAKIINSKSELTGELYVIDAKINNQNLSLNQLKRNYCLGATMALKKDIDLVLKEGVLEIIDDYQVSLEYILAGYDIHIVNDFLIKYRIHESNISNNNRKLYKKTVRALKSYNILCFEKVLFKRGYTSKEIYVSLGVFELFRDNVEDGYYYLLKAYDDISKEIEINFENNFYLGVALYKINKKEESYNYFKRALEFKANNPSTLNNIGVLVFELRSDLEEALALFKKSVAIEPNYIDGQNNLQYIQKGVVGNSLKITERILSSSIVKRREYIN
ncbi:glycosyltransferase [Bacillus tianshenii]|nr:glycosyltransferase [Bacillus tianshenii]